VFDTVIPRNVRLAEAPSYGLPGVIFDPAAKGSQAFIAFAEELVRKMPPASALAAEQPSPLAPGAPLQQQRDAIPVPVPGPDGY
jgi:chromosome partitioning protein